ncbi:MAG: helix-turn-helix domain-containing protein [Gemmatimonadota bacterium]|jgi:DNA-binding IclR family transcriptional regulator
MSKARARQRIVDHLENAAEPLTADEVSDATGLPPDEAVTQLNVLRRRGAVVNRRGRRWAIPAAESRSV